MREKRKDKFTLFIDGNGSFSGRKLFYCIIGGGVKKIKKNKKKTLPLAPKNKVDDW